MALTLAEFQEVRFDSVYPIVAREYSSYNCHRAILELRGKGRSFSKDDFKVLRKEIRKHFRISFLKGFGFGVFLDDFDVPAEVVEACVDNTSGVGGACQWVIAARERGKQALGVHMWQKGKMTGVYEEMLARLTHRGFSVVNRARSPQGFMKFAMIVHPLLALDLYKPPGAAPVQVDERDE